MYMREPKISPPGLIISQMPRTLFKKQYIFRSVINFLTNIVTCVKTNQSEKKLQRHWQIKHQLE